MGKNCLVSQFCSERLSGPLWDGGQRTKCVIPFFPPHKDPKQRGLLHLSLSFCGVLLPQGGWEKGEGGLFRNDVHFFTGLHRRAGPEQVRPSEQTVAGGILSWGGNMRLISLHTQGMATAGILITLGPDRIYFT